MYGAMQDYELTLEKILDHAAKWHASVEVVSAGVDSQVARIGYAEVRARSNRLSGALAQLGLVFGDRLATLAWNTQHHLEVWYGVMGAGLICHTLNPRLTIAHLSMMVQEAADRLLCVGGGQTEQALELVRLCPSLEALVILDGGDVPAREQVPAHVAIWTFETLLERLGQTAAWGGFDERTAAGLCYTSGTTGKPKGVLYSHRSNWLLTQRTLQADAMALTSNDVVLVAVPMFHANGWGLPFAAPAVGAKLVLPGRQLDGESLADMITGEGVTVAAGVQTVWQALLNHLDTAGGETPTLKRVLIGGSHCPQALIDRLENRLGAQVQTSWGMTELSPFGTITPPGAAPGEAKGSGRAPLGLEMELTDADGRPLPEQRNVVGHLKVKGPSVSKGYFGVEALALDERGFFDTGDLALIDDEGYLTIAGRSKDLIKSGGEWINPTEMEAIVGHGASVAQAAVIARPDPKWGERPVLVVELAPGHAFDPDVLLAMLRGSVPDWWLPDRVIEVARMPLAATGKIDKAQLRLDYGSL